MYPTLEQAKIYRDRYRIVPVSREIMSDIRTPIEVLRILKNTAGTAISLKASRIRKNGDAILFWGILRQWKSAVQTEKQPSEMSRREK